jgi:hypothetical protein
LGTLLLLDNGSFGLAAARAGSYIFHSIWVFGYAYYHLTVTKQ